MNGIPMSLSEVSLHTVNVLELNRTSIAARVPTNSRRLLELEYHYEPRGTAVRQLHLLATSCST